MRLRLKNGVLTKTVFLVRPAKSGISGSVWTDHVDSSTVFYRRVDHDEWYIDRLNHLLIGQFKQKLAQNEA